MRPIEFRAQRADTREWVYGNLFVPNKMIKGVYICPDTTFADFMPGYDYADDIEKAMSDGCALGHFIEVIPETVGQLVYIDQRSEQRYYEGDMDKNGDVLMYNKELGLFAMHSYYSVFNKWSPSSYAIDFSRVKIIGTIHDKPEKP